VWYGVFADGFLASVLVATLAGHDVTDDYSFRIDFFSKRFNDNTAIISMPAGSKRLSCSAPFTSGWSENFRVGFTPT
jgi:hypothetical protein